MLTVANHRISKTEKLHLLPTLHIMEPLPITSASQTSSWMVCLDGKD